jgi:hypothetical protein
MLAVQVQRKQVVGYVEASIKEELTAMKAANRRLSESELVEEALAIAMPELKQRHPSLKMPVQGSPGKRKSAA